MKDIVDDYKLKRKREVKDKKRQTEKEKKEKLERKKEEGKIIEKVEAKKPTPSIVKSKMKLIKIERTMIKPIVISTIKLNQSLSAKQKK
jgi:hypothetical protein